MTTTPTDGAPSPTPRRTRVTITTIIDVDETAAKRYIFPPTMGDPEGLRALDAIVIDARQSIVDRISGMDGGEGMDGFLVDDRTVWSSYDADPVPAVDLLVG